MSFIPGNVYNVEAQQAQADHEAKVNEEKASEALKKAEEYKSQFGATGPGGTQKGPGVVTLRHDAVIPQLNTAVNEAMADLATVTRPGETPEAAVARIEADPRNAGKEAVLIAQMAVAAQTSLHAELMSKDRTMANAQAEADEHDFNEMKSARKRDLRQLATRIAREEGISMADAIQLALMEVEVDGADRTLPGFSKMKGRYLASFDE